MAEKELNDRENLLLAARMTHNNEIMDVAEVLNETNDIVSDAIVQRANDITSHVVSRRTSLPAVSWVKVGNGWTATTGLVGQARETMGMLKARYMCPEDVMRLQPNPAKYRANQERAYIESMGQELANTLVGNVSAGAISPAVAPPEEFAGFQYRYNALGTTDTNYVVSNGHTTDDNTNTSIWFVQWRPDGVYLIYPRNTDGGGLKKKDEGRIMVPGNNAGTSVVTNNSMMYAYVTEFSWDVGLCVEDQRCVKRLCNINPTVGGENSLDEDNIIKIRNNFKGAGTIYMYCNEAIYTQLQILAKDKSNVNWTENNPFGKPQMYFLDMPIRRCDAITNAEPVIA